MLRINEETFIQELYRLFPEFTEVSAGLQIYPMMGYQSIFWDFRSFAEDAISKNNQALSERIVNFVVRCISENTDEVRNHILSKFFEDMNKESLTYFFNALPAEFVIELKAYLHAFGKSV